MPADFNEYCERYFVGNVRCFKWLFFVHNVGAKKRKYFILEYTHICTFAMGASGQFGWLAVCKPLVEGDDIMFNFQINPNYLIWHYCYSTLRF